MKYQFYQNDNKIQNDLLVDNPFFFSLVNKKRNENRKKLRSIAVNRHQLSLSKPQEYYNSKILFRLKEPKQQNSGPSVGDYQISCPIVKPAVQTYQKNDEIILVKINHIGGTSSFRNEEDRFASGSSSSIYPMIPSPGPGTYQTIQPVNKRYKQINKNHQGYGLIRQILKNTHEATISMPNYQIQNKSNELHYNGIPKHLQLMYNQLNNKSQTLNKLKSMPLQKIINQRKKLQTLPMKSNRNTLDIASFRDPSEASLSQQNKNLKQLTQTLYKLSQNRKREQQKQRKLDELLKGRPRKRSVSLPFNNQRLYNRQGIKKEQIFTKNMVNILFDKATKI